MPEIKKRKSGKKGRKIGRNLAKCKAYMTAGKRETNKVNKLQKHIIKTKLNDKVAIKRLQTLDMTRGKRYKKKQGKQK